MDAMKSYGSDGELRMDRSMAAGTANRLRPVTVQDHN